MSTPGITGRFSGTLVALLLLGTFPANAEEPVNLEIVYQIKEEAFLNSGVMDTLFQLTDVHGPRLSGSPAHHAAANWAIHQLQDWGIRDASVEEWGPFGRSWSYERLAAHMIEPRSTPLVAVPMAWCRGTSGPVRAPVVLAPLFTEESDVSIRYDLPGYAKRIEEYADRQRGTLKGKFVLLHTARDLEPATTPPVDRLDHEELAALGTAPEPVSRQPYEYPLLKLPADPEERAKAVVGVPLEVTSSFYQERRRIEARLHHFLAEEQAAGVLRVDDRGAGSIIFSEAGGSFEVGAAIPPPTLMLAPESYNPIVRLLEHDIPVTIEIDLGATIVDAPVQGRNIIAEIRGRSKPDEIVMLGAHFDSWHVGTGATDNASGSAVAMEVMRILATLELPMDRTVRLALWDGEEQGLHGSRAYVRRRFADPVTMELERDHGTFSAYFNLDNGGGKIRGVYLQGNEMARPIFEQLLAPFRDLGVTTVSIRDTRGTDHLSFDAVGLPGFQFIQDPLDYMSRTHHSNLDVYDHVEPADLMQAAAVMASVVYHAATRDERFPRKALPGPLPPRTAMIE